MIKQQFISKRFDEAAILTALVKVAFEPEPVFGDAEYSVIASLRRSSPDWDLPIDEIGERLSLYSEDQIGGLISNVKGILHEMEFVRLENEDGDSIFASLYPDTNQKSLDIQMFDESTQNQWSIQLKATDDVSYVNSWIESNEDAEILVTNELSEKMGLPSSGMDNEALTVRVESFVDRLIDLKDATDTAIWDYIPPLIVASSGIIVFEIWRRYRRNELTLEEFRWLTLRTLGVKTGKYVSVFAALAVPGLNVIIGAYLLGSFVLALSKYYDKTPNFKPFAVFGSSS